MLESSPAEAAGYAREVLRPALRRGDLLAVASAGILLTWPLAQLGDLARAARLLGSAVGFFERAGARREWMDESCEAAALHILRDRLDAPTMQALLAEGRSAPLEAVARDALENPLVTVGVAE
jgi:hypothetical protein